jgi:hypothetical protein
MRHACGAASQSGGMLPSWRRGSQSSSPEADERAAPVFSKENPNRSRQGLWAVWATRAHAMLPALPPGSGARCPNRCGQREALSKATGGRSGAALAALERLGLALSPSCPPSPSAVALSTALRGPTALASTTRDVASVPTASTTSAPGHASARWHQPERRGAPPRAPP